MKSLLFILSLLWSVTAQGLVIGHAALAAASQHSDATNYFGRLAANGGSLDISAFQENRITEAQARAGITSFFKRVSGKSYFAKIERLSILYGTNAASYLVPLIAKKGGNLDTDTGSVRPGVAMNGLFGIANTQLEFGIGRSSPIDERGGFGLHLWFGDIFGNSSKYIDAGIGDLGANFWQVNRDNGLGYTYGAYAFDTAGQADGFFRDYYSPANANFYTGHKRIIFNQDGGAGSAPKLAHNDGTTYKLWANNGNDGAMISLVCFTSGEWTPAEDADFSHQIAQLQYDLNRVSPEIGGVGVWTGDSVTQGGGYNKHASRTARTYGLREINTGVSGTGMSSLGDGLSLVENITGRLLTPLSTNNSRTPVFINAGLNNLRHDGVSKIDEFTNALHSVIQALTNAGVDTSRIVIGSPPQMDPASYGSYSPFNNGSLAAQTNFAYWTSNVVRAYRGLRYAPVWESMIVVPGYATNLVGDGIHPNDAGHLVINRAVVNARVLTP